MTLNSTMFKGSPDISWIFNWPYPAELLVFIFSRPEKSAWNGFGFWRPWKPSNIIEFNVNNVQGLQDTFGALHTSTRGLPKDWRRRPGCPRHTWLWTLNADLHPLNHGLNSAWQLAKDRERWRQLVEMATLQFGARSWWWMFKGFQGIQKPKPFQELFFGPWKKIKTRSSAVAVIAYHTAYKVCYRYRLLAGIAKVSMSIYLFTVSSWSLLLMPEVWYWCLSAFSCFLFCG